jgi:hypothetical protein
MEMISLISPYTVGPTGDFTQEAFEWYKKLAEADFAIDDPGLSAEKADEAVANLICDIFASSQGGRELTQPATNGVTRIDSTLPKQFKFDGQPVRTFEDD